MVIIWRYTSITIKCIAIVFCLVILISLILLLIKQKKYENNQKHRQRRSAIKPAIKIWSILAIIFYIISITSLLIGEIIIDSIYWFGIPYGITSITWSMANCCVYFLFMTRIRSIFSNTMYKSPFYVYLIISIFVFIYFCCESTYCLFESKLYKLFFNEISKTKIYKILNSVSVIECITDFCISISLATLFIKKLFKVNLSLLDTDIYSTVSSQNRSSISITNNYKDIDINKNQQKLVEIITKQTILTLFSTFTTQIWLLYYIPIVFIFAYDNGNIHFNTKYKLQKISEIWGVIDCCVNSLMVLLAFIFVSNLYNKICGFCHKKCVNYCKALTQKQVANELIRYRNTEFSDMNSPFLTDLHSL